MGSDYNAYIQERKSGLVHRIVVHEGVPFPRCHRRLPDQHAVIEPDELLRLAMMGDDRLCQICFAPVEDEVKNE